MNLDKKKLGLIITFLLIILIIFSSALIGKQKTKKPAKPLPSLRGQLSKIFDEKVFWPLLSSDGKSLYFYSRTPSAFVKLNLASQRKEILAKLDKNIKVEEVVWSPDGSGVIYKTRYEFLPEEVFYYNFLSKKRVALPQGIETIIWPIPEKIYYHFVDWEQSTLNQSKPDGSERKKLADLERDFYGFNLVGPDLLAYWASPSDVSGSTLYLLDLKKGTSRAISKKDEIGDALVSPGGNKIALVLFHPDQQLYTIGIKDLKTGKTIDSKIKSNLDKITWLSNGKILFVASWGRVGDRFYSIDSTTGKKKEIKYQTKETSIINSHTLMPTPDSKTLYFTSRNFLYKLELK